MTVRGPLHYLVHFFNSILEKQGISKSCLTYFNGLNSRLGERAFGAEQTVTGTVQAKVEEQIKQAKAIDEQKGISKTAHDVRPLRAS